jgi:hypothetical protein
MNKWNINLNLLLFLTSVLFSEGHVSSGISKIDINELVQRSHAILLVSKNSPYVLQKSIKFPDSIKEEFNATLYSFKIKAIVQSSIDSLKVSNSILVHSASDEDNFNDMKSFLQGGPRRGRIHNYYDSKTNHIDEKQEFMIFIRFNEMNGWYSFTAGGAMESKEMLDKIWSANPKPNRNPKEN